MLESVSADVSLKPKPTKQARCLSLCQTHTNKLWRRSATTLRPAPHCKDMDFRCPVAPGHWQGILWGSRDPSYPMIGLGNIEAGSKPSALCHLPQTVPEWYLRSGAAHYPFWQLHESVIIFMWVIRISATFRWEQDLEFPSRTLPHDGIFSWLL